MTAWQDFLSRGRAGFVRAALTVLVAAGAVGLPGCGVFGGAPAPVPTVMLDQVGATPAPGAANSSGVTTAAARSTGVVTASAVAAPAVQARLAASLGGSVRAVLVKAGETVQSGQVLVRFAGSEKLDAAREAVNLELLSAQQVLKVLNDPEALTRARAAAQLRLAKAEKALDEAEKHRKWQDYRIGSVNAIESARADVVLTDQALTDAQDAFDKLAGRGEDDPARAAALKVLTAARRNHDTAVANLNYLLGVPDPLDVAQVEAELQVAQAEHQAALAEVERLKAGPDPDAVALAEERIKNAQAQLAANAASLADLELKAPFDGTAVEVTVHAGEWVAPGQALILLADVAHLQFQTTDLSERDVPRVQVGQAVSVYIKALDANAAGKLAAISPLADTLGGDVIYRATIELDSLPAGLRAGMSAEVTFQSP